jgi:Flp pilus assembly protein TadG
MQILSAILLIAGIFTWLYRGKLQIEKAAEKAATRVAADQAKKEAKKQTVKFLKRQEAG